MSVDSQLVQGGRIFKSRPLPLKDFGDLSIKQIAILQEDGDVIYGHKDVRLAIWHNPQLRDKDLLRFKLVLHPEWRQVDEVKHTLEILFAQEDRRAVQDFLVDFFRRIILDVRTVQKSPNFRCGENDAYWDDIPLEFEICVPAMWDDDARGVLTNAAKIAGGFVRPKVELQEEPLCVATSYVMELIENGCLKLGHCVLVVDCGEGTLDIAIVKLLQVPGTDQLLELERIGLCSGNSAGSIKINIAAEEWFLSGACEELEQRGVEGTCRALGISRLRLKREFSDEIDKIEGELEKTYHNVFVAEIRNGHNGPFPGSIDRLSIRVTRDQLESWYATWTEPGMELLDDHLKSVKNVELPWAILTGGGSKSEEWRNKMQSILTQYDIKIGAYTRSLSACSEGALMQHRFLEDSLPSKAYFYIVQDEYYDAKRHPDAFRNSRLRDTSEFDQKERIVRDRLRRIMKHSQPQDFEDDGYLPMLFYPKSGGDLPRTHVDLVWSEKPLAPHSPLYNQDGSMKAGIRKYPLVFVDMKDFSEYGFEVQNSNVSDVAHFIVKGFVSMECTSDNLSLSVHLMKHDFEFAEEAEESKSSAFVLVDICIEHVLTFDSPPNRHSAEKRRPDS